MNVNPINKESWENYTEQHKWFRNLGQSVNEEFRKLVELKPPRLSITHWALLSCLPVYFSWHLCLPVNLTLPPPTPSTGPSDTHAVPPDNALTSSASLNFPFELWLCLTAQSRAVHIISWVKGTSETGYCQQPCLHLLPY